MGIKLDAKKVIGIASIFFSVVVWIINRSLKIDYVPVMYDTGVSTDGTPPNSTEPTKG